MPHRGFNGGFGIWTTWTVGVRLDLVAVARLGAVGVLESAVLACPRGGLRADFIHAAAVHLRALIQQGPRASP
jgi:hypothetical protein